MASREITAYTDLMRKRPDLFPMGNIVTDESVLEDYAQSTGRKVGVVYESRWHYLIVDVVSDADGNPRGAFERFVTRSTQPGAVIVPVLPDGRYCLVNHYRHNSGTTALEFPRGFGADGEGGWDAAIRELAEELGAVPTASRVLGKTVADSGVNGDEVSVVEAAIDCYGGARDAAEEIWGAVTMTRDELNDAIRTGRVTDGFTLTALAMKDAAGGWD